MRCLLGGSRKNGVEARGQISHFMTPVKIRGGVGENVEWEYTLRPHPWYDELPLYGVEVQESGKKMQQRLSRPSTYLADGRMM